MPSTNNSTGRSFSSELCMLFCVTLLGNGILLVSYPSLDLSVSWAFVLDSLLLLLVFLHNPPILALFFELASMAMLPTMIADYTATKNLKLAGISIAMMNAAVIIQCYGLYHVGSWAVGRRSSSRRDNRSASVAEVIMFPKLLTGLNPFLEIITLFACNTFTMTSVCSLQFQAINLKVSTGISMIFFSILYLMSSQVTTLRRVLEDAFALQADPAVTGEATLPPRDEEETVQQLEEAIEVVEQEPAGSSTAAVAAVAVAAAADEIV